MLDVDYSNTNTHTTYIYIYRLHGPTLSLPPRYYFEEQCPVTGDIIVGFGNEIVFFGYQENINANFQPYSKKSKTLLRI